MSSFRKLTLAENNPLANILFVHRESERSDDTTEDADSLYYSTASDLECDSELEGQDDPWDEDITLRPKTAIQHSKPSSRQRRRQRSLAVVKPPAIHPRAMPLTPMASKPLVFPVEVLEIVCHYLSQATLRFSASLVSRRWNVVCNPFISRTVLWKALSSHSDQFVLDTLREVKSFECWLHADPEVGADCLPYMQVGFRLNAWGAFWPRLLVPIKQRDSSTVDNSHNNQSRNGSSVNSDGNLCLMDTIQHFRLFCEPSTHPDKYFKGLLPHFRSLRSLEIRVFGSNPGCYSIFTILDSSPQLRLFKFCGPRYRQYDLIAGDDDDYNIDPPEEENPPEEEIDPETAHFPVKPKVVIPPNKSYPQRYRLEVFDVFLVNVNQRVLERLISTCPELQILRVLEANAPYWTEHHRYVTQELKYMRLFDHAKDCCPRLVSIEVLHRAREATDLLHLDRIAKFFPDASMLTLNCSGHMPDPPGLEARRLLSQITYLHIRVVDANRTFTTYLDRILCLTPRLLHFICNEFQMNCEDLKFLPTAVVEERPQFITHNRTRKNAVREERRVRRRQSLLAIEQTSSLARSTREALGTNPLPEVPLYWQCHDLRTLDLDARSLLRLGEYVQQQQLFQRLTSLKLRIPLLYIGQYQNIPDCKKLPSGAKAKSNSVGQKSKKLSATTTTTTATATATTTVPPGFSPKAVIPPRHPDDLKSLHDLPSLELLVIYTKHLSGMVHYSDFEFLRRAPSPVVTAVASHVSESASSSSPFSSSSSPSLSSSTPAAVVWTEDMVTFSPAEAQSTEPEGLKADRQEHNKEEGQGLRQTCWPRLQMFKIRYAVSPLQNNYSKVVAGMERIRPGVEFQIKMMPLEAMSCN